MSWDMILIHIVGRKNNGKTTLIVELLNELKNRGLRVGTMKHSGHVHELDKPGKDSFQHREAGGNPAVVATKNQVAVFLPRAPEEDPFKNVTSLFEKTDLVLVEGYIMGPGIKVEVWRKEKGNTPLIFERNDIKAVITEDDIDTDFPVWPRNEINEIADNICSLAAISK